MLPPSLTVVKAAITDGKRFIFHRDIASANPHFTAVTRECMSLRSSFRSRVSEGLNVISRFS